MLPAAGSKGIDPVDGQPRFSEERLPQVHGSHNGTRELVHGSSVFASGAHGRLADHVQRVDGQLRQDVHGPVAQLRQLLRQRHGPFTENLHELS